ncbi:uncharacterized mitochondrial protein AtMg00810-like [Lycium barbarum]|uniref:uncharacterized mitochondrial protein AtMg00810-like n=1 Tax=Lycium barbarum TaxID=112863 RepID=UPI00293F5C3E|nr:uncharacterized mitochondrial protein AtMg00810-like [Lycium barbarum]
MALLASEFAMKDLGPLNYFLGIHVTRHKDGLFLSQRKYAEEIIDRARMSSCKATSTPVDTKPKVSSTSGAPYDDPTHNRSLAGALQYLTFMRPDISYVVQQGTLDYGLHFYPSSVTDLLSYTDADWGAALTHVGQRLVIVSSLEIT